MVKLPSRLPEVRIVRENGRRPARIGMSAQKRAWAAERSAHMREQMRNVAAVAFGMAPLLVVVGLGFLMMWSAAMAASP